MALMKAVRGIELGLDTLELPKFADKTAEELAEVIAQCDDERLFAVYEGLKKGLSKDRIYEISKIDHFFLSKIENLIRLEKELGEGELDVYKRQRLRCWHFWP